MSEMNNNTDSEVRLRPDLILPLNLDYVRTEEPPKIKYVLPSLPMGSVGILSGAGGTGKSMLALQLMFTVAAGNGCDFSLNRGDWVQPDIAPKNVTYLSIEDPIDILHGRLHHIIKHYENSDMQRQEWLNTGLLNLIKVYPLAGSGFALMNQEGRATVWLEPIIHTCKGSRLIFVDTMRRAHDADENNNGTMSIFLKLCEILAAQTGAAVVLLHHENKSSAGNDESGSESLRGASAIVDNARWVGRVKKMSHKEAADFGLHDDERSWYLKLSVEKNNYGAPVPPIWLERKEHGILVPAALEALKPRPHGGRASV